MNPLAITLVSFELCPYVQRAAIVLLERSIPFERIYVDLENKPDWFKAASPLGKVPLLKVGDQVLFESAPIVEYLDDAYQPRLHPDDPLERARHRAWMEFGSGILADIWVVETTADVEAYDAKLTQIRRKFERLEVELGDGPYFSGTAFRVVDAVFAPIFRYFDVFETMAPMAVFEGLDKLRSWRAAMRERPSVQAAVVHDYAQRLRAFVLRRGGVLARGARTPARLAISSVAETPASVRR